MTPYQKEKGEELFVESRLNPNQIVLFRKVCERRNLDRFRVMEEVLKSLTLKADTFDLAYKLLSIGAKSKVQGDMELEKESGQSCLMYYLDRTAVQYGDEKVASIFDRVRLVDVFSNLQEGYMKKPFFWDTYSGLVSMFGRESLQWDMKNNSQILTSLGADMSQSGLDFAISIQKKLAITRKTGHVIGLVKDVNDDSAVLIFVTKLLIGLEGDHIHKILKRLEVDGVTKIKKVLVDEARNDAAKYKIPFDKKQVVGFMKKSGLVFDEDFEGALKIVLGRLSNSIDS